MDEKLKARIDVLTYYQMFHMWRFAPSGSPYFRGEAGEYFLKRMRGLEEKLEPGEKAAISKAIGWER